MSSTSSVCDSEDSFPGQVSDSHPTPTRKKTSATKPTGSNSKLKGKNCNQTQTHHTKGGKGGNRSNDDHIHSSSIPVSHSQAAGAAERVASFRVQHDNNSGLITVTRVGDTSTVGGASSHGGTTSVGDVSSAASRRAGRSTSASSPSSGTRRPRRVSPEREVEIPERVGGETPRETPSQTPCDDLVSTGNEGARGGNNNVSPRAVTADSNLSPGNRRARETSIVHTNGASGRSSSGRTKRHRSRNGTPISSSRNKKVMSPASPLRGEGSHWSERGSSAVDEDTNAVTGDVDSNEANEGPKRKSRSGSPNKRKSRRSGSDGSPPKSQRKSQGSSNAPSKSSRSSRSRSRSKSGSSSNSSSGSETSDSPSRGRGRSGRQRGRSRRTKKPRDASPDHERPQHEPRRCSVLVLANANGNDANVSDSKNDSKNSGEQISIRTIKTQDNKGPSQKDTTSESPVDGNEAANNVTGANNYTDGTNYPDGVADVDGAAANSNRTGGASANGNRDRTPSRDSVSSYSRDSVSHSSLHTLPPTLAGVKGYNSPHPRKSGLKARRLSHSDSHFKSTDYRDKLQVQRKKRILKFKMRNSNGKKSL